MRVRIYQPSRNAMQSGVARTKGWVLEFVREDHPSLDPLMGWTTSEDTQSQVRLRFDTRAEAEAPLLAANPQGRFVEVDEVAACVLWLCSDAAASVTGQAIAISGGEV